MSNCTAASSNLIDASFTKPYFEALDNVLTQITPTQASLFGATLGLAYASPQHNLQNAMKIVCGAGMAYMIKNNAHAVTGAVLGASIGGLPTAAIGGLISYLADTGTYEVINTDINIHFGKYLTSNVHAEDIAFLAAGGIVGMEMAWLWCTKAAIAGVAGSPGIAPVAAVVGSVVSWSSLIFAGAIGVSVAGAIDLAASYGISLTVHSPIWAHWEL